MKKTRKTTPWKYRQRNYPTNLTLPQIFEEQVNRTPSSIAVVFKKKRLTYSELNTKANQLARYLRKKGVKPEKTVVVSMDRSFEVYIALMAIQKAGGAYVPVEPFNPNERLKFIVKDCDPIIIITQKSLKNKFRGCGKLVFCIDSDWIKIKKEEENNLIYKNAVEIFNEKPKTVFLGGDHSISYSTVKAFFDSVRNEGKKPCLVIFDAHVDLMPPMSEPTHEEWLRALIEDSEVNFPAENILIIGARNLYKSEIEYMNKKKIKTITMNQIAEVGIHEMCDSIMEFAQGKDKELYLSIDIDALDPAYAPATGYNEPGGLTTREFLYILQRINKLKNLRIIDIVEINEKKDKESFHGVTVRLGAKILSEFL